MLAGKILLILFPSRSYRSTLYPEGGRDNVLRAKRRPGGGRVFEG